jgi:hypothetical protein
MNFNLFTAEERQRLIEGGRVTVGRKVFMICRKCRRLINIAKPLFGSWHICDEDDEEVTEKPKTMAICADCGKPTGEIHNCPEQARANRKARGE